MFDTASNSASGMTAGLKGTYQPNSYNKVDLSYSTSETSNNLGLKYTRDFGNNWRGFV